MILNYYTLQYRVVGKTYTHGQAINCINIGIEHRIFMYGYTYKQIMMLIELEAVKQLHQKYGKFEMYIIDNIVEAPKPATP
jgi:hypothetical protein